MDARGTITGFTLPEFIEILALRQKTGRLTISHADAVIRIDMVEGSVVHGAGSEENSVGGRLTASLAGSPGLLEEAVKEQKKNGRPLTSVLIERDLVTKARADRVAVDLVSDLFFEILEWEDPDYEFDSGQVSAERFGPFRVEDLVAEAQKRQQEWAAIREVIPSLDHMVRAVPEVTSDQVTVSRAEWGLLVLIARPASVENLCEVLGRSPYEICKQLCGLTERSLVEVAAGAPAVEASKAKSGDSGKTKRKYVTGSGSNDPAAAALPAEWVSYYERLGVVSSRSGARLGAVAK